MRRLSLPKVNSHFGNGLRLLEFGLSCVSKVAGGLNRGFGCRLWLWLDGIGSKQAHRGQFIEFGVFAWGFAEFMGGCGDIQQVVDVLEREAKIDPGVLQTVE